MNDDLYERGFVDKILGDIFYTTTPKAREDITAMTTLDKTTPVLTVACRTGETAFYIAKTFECPVQGVDFFDDNIKEAEKTARREKLTKLVSFKKAFAENLPFDDNQYDVVFLERSLSCYEHKEKVISECLRVLKPGGIFSMSDFTVDNLDADKREALKELTCLVTALPLNEYIHLMDTNGLGEIKSEDREDIAEKNTKVLIQKWKKLRLFPNIFLKASSADAGRFENLMRMGEQAIKDRQLGYAFFYGRKTTN